MSKPLTRDLHWTPFFSLFKRETRRFFKVFFQTVASPLISVFLYMLIFGASIGKEIQPAPGISYLAFLLPGLVMMSSLRNAFDNSSGSIITSKFVGELESLKISPLSKTQIAWAYALGGMVRGTFVAVLNFLVGLVFEWLINGEAHTGIDSPLWFCYFLFIGGLGMGNLGLAAAMFSRSIEQVTAFSTFILLPLIYLGGVFFSLSKLSIFWQRVAELNPLLYVVNGMRYALIGVSDFSILTMASISAAFLLATYCFALLSLQYGSFKRW